MLYVSDRGRYLFFFIAVVLGSIFYSTKVFVSILGVGPEEHSKATSGTSAAITVTENQSQSAPAVMPPTLLPTGEQRAFRFLLTGDHLDLTAVNETRGDFHQRRGPLSWQPGMLYARLLDIDQQVLAEDTLPAPDAECVVLDPHIPGADGEPKSAVLTATGPVVFQFRMPRMDSATHMEVYRLSGSQPTVADEKPIGVLLASILLGR